MRFALAGVIFLLLLVVATVFQHESDGYEPTVTPPTVTIGETVVAVEIADTAALRERGLSGRPSLAEGTGMLFIFPEPARPGFWMMDMHFPIDILWISGEEQEGRIAHIDADVLPETYPAVFVPPQDVRFVLEVPAGFSARNRIAIGDAVIVARK